MKKKPQPKFWKDSYGGIHPITQVDEKTVTKIEETPTFEPEPLREEELKALIDLKDMEDDIANALLDKHKNIAKLKQLSEEELAEISGIGKKRAKSIWKQLKEL